MELIRQEGLSEGTFAHETGNRNDPLRHCEGFYELPDSAKKLISQVRRGEKTSVLLYLKNAFLLFEHKEGGEPDPNNNNKRVGYQVYRYSLQNYPGLMESIRPQILPKSVSENVQQDSFEKAETPISDELVREIKQLAEWVRENEQHKLSEQASFEKSEKHVLDEVVREVKELAELVRNNKQPQLPKKPPDKYQSLVSVLIGTNILLFFFAIITLLVGSFGVLVYKKVENTDGQLSVSKNNPKVVETAQNTTERFDEIQTLLKKVKPEIEKITKQIASLSPANNNIGNRITTLDQKLVSIETYIKTLSELTKSISNECCENDISEIQNLLMRLRLRIILLRTLMIQNKLPPLTVADDN